MSKIVRAAVAVACVAVAGAALGAAAGSASPSPTAKRACPAPPAQSITELRNIGCDGAQRVYRKHADQGLECRGDGRSFSGGWKFVGVGRPGEVIEAKATKGSKSFHYGGGGAC